MICSTVALVTQEFGMEAQGEDWQEWTILTELLAEREVLVDLQCFMELCELFSVCQYPTHLLISSETVKQL